MSKMSPQLWFQRSPCTADNRAWHKPWDSFDYRWGFYRVPTRWRAALSPPRVWWRSCFKVPPFDGRVVVFFVSSWRKNPPGKDRWQSPLPCIGENHGPVSIRIRIATFWEWRSPSTFTMVGKWLLLMLVLFFWRESSRGWEGRGLSFCLYLMRLGFGIRLELLVG